MLIKYSEDLIESIYERNNEGRIDIGYLGQIEEVLRGLMECFNRSNEYPMFIEDYILIKVEDKNIVYVDGNGNVITIVFKEEGSVIIKDNISGAYLATVSPYSNEEYYLKHGDSILLISDGMESFYSQYTYWVGVKRKAIEPLKIREGNEVIRVKEVVGEETYNVYFNRGVNLEYEFSKGKIPYKVFKLKGGVLEELYHKDYKYSEINFDDLDYLDFDDLFDD